MFLTDPQPKETPAKIFKPRQICEGHHPTTILGSLSFRNFVRMYFFEADALENGRADIASYKEQQQNKSEGSEPSHALNELLQLAMEHESRQDIHTGIKERANSIHQQEAPATDLDSARTQGHKYAKGQEFRRGEHL